jgi:hypothetical protein
VWQVIEVVHWIAVFTWLYSMVADQPNAEAMGRFYAAAVVISGRAGKDPALRSALRIAGEDPVSAALPPIRSGS